MYNLLKQKNQTWEILIVQMQIMTINLYISCQKIIELFNK